MTAAASIALPQRPEDRPLVMGVVNVTPDSFSDGGRFFDAAAAVAHGRELVGHGADIIDIGGESTRPGAQRPSVEEELRRVIPVIEGLADSGAWISIDTMRAPVASAAVAAGARIINDVSGGLADPEMTSVAAQTGAGFVVMHWRGHSHDMQTRAIYDDVTADVCRELADQVGAALDAGVSRDQVVIDPGLGFAKTAEQNWILLQHLSAFQQMKLPVLVGASRKSFLSRVGSRGDGPVPAEQRDFATAAVSVVLAQAGVWAIRVHEVRSTFAACDVVRHLREATAGASQGAQE
ncbi:dihydropteroate synthase [Flexivirga oryzae]|uniref:Dihydropteroate synthase n=1 Tax=Flexivirga oryzae TaxID=1794944 RepID=A0A839N9U6_9MICO|nr:dihydropteroate synthase [Flexivirga oryzae]MBB2892963.1 dihydropteroate synthase [Flexivirga oryzae]